MQSLRLWNVRSFDDTGEIALKKLTILVGKNASGKSTLARWFPLLRQSVTSPSASPLLWYVEGGAEDFGKVTDVVRRGQKELGFGFRVENAGELIPEAGGSMWVDVVLDASTTPGVVATIQMVVGTDTVVIFLVDGIFDKVSVNQSIVGVGVKADIGLRHLLPVSWPSPVTSISGQVGWQETALHARVHGWMRDHMDGKTGAARVDSLLFALGWVPLERFKQELETIPEAPKSFRGTVQRMIPLRVQPWRYAIIAREAIAALVKIDDYLRTEALGVTYIGPFRHSPSRYERVSNIATDIVDHSGANLAMVLRSMTHQEREALSDWLMKYLDFGVILEGDEHVQVRIRERSGKEVNIIDTGFGYSQILPVAVALWRALNSQKTRTLVLEQPELHLHPGLQTPLGRLLAAVAAEPTPPNVPPLKLIVETHSEALINAIGESVELGSLSRDDVNVVLFERDDVSGISTVKQRNFDADGRLEDWPYGFFAG